MPQQSLLPFDECHNAGRCEGGQVSKCLVVYFADSSAAGDLVKDAVDAVDQVVAMLIASKLHLYFLEEMAELHELHNILSIFCTMNHLSIC